MFQESFICDLKDRVLVSDIVGKSVVLKRKGREFSGLSPFTNEKTPSFTVNDEKGFYHCFSSGKHGDAIDFLCETQGMSFVEAIQYICDVCGIDIPDDSSDNKEDYSNWIRYTSYALKVYSSLLMGKHGSEARDYLRGRGFLLSDIQEFNIGYAPDSFDCLTNLFKKNTDNIDDVFKSGVISGDEKGKYWDRFRDRIIFPIHDARGRPVGFGGRALQKNDAKYLNSPDSPLFKKGSLLYNYHRARKYASDPKSSIRGLIVVEGYTDVISLARNGINHSVAPMGTALTEDQISLLWKIGPEPVVCLDGDRAGIEACYKALERALPEIKYDKTLKFCILPNKKDPDDYIRNNGIEKFKELIENAKSFSDMMWDMEYYRYPLDTPEAKAGFKTRFLNLCSKIKDSNTKKEYINFMYERIKEQRNVKTLSAVHLTTNAGESPWDVRFKNTLKKNTSK